MDIVDRISHPALAGIVDAVIAIWPKHARQLGRSFAGRDAELLVHSEKIAGLIESLAAERPAGVHGLAESYRFLCEEIVLPEEMHFRRTGAYRLKTFADAFEQVYGNAPFMARYMDGLLLSAVLWENHTRASKNLVDHFLPALSEGASLLEIGPGHGLLLYLAGENERVASLDAWDVSAASLDASASALKAMGSSRQATFALKNVFDSTDRTLTNQRFDAIILSEVLEHLEEPAEAVRALFDLCNPGGHVWINVPANSPAPDHLYLVEKPADVEALIRDAGFKIIETTLFPMTGTTLEKAIAQKLTITCVLHVQRP